MVTFKYLSVVFAFSIGVSVSRLYDFVLSSGASRVSPQSDNEVDHCRGHTCGGGEAGSCRQEGDGYSCSCNEGFEVTVADDSDSSVSASSSSDECDANPCGGQEAGTCIASRSGYACSCAPGYVLSGSGGHLTCTKADGGSSSGPPGSGDGSPSSPCAGNPCGSPKAGTCIPSEQSGYACSCNAGYTLSMADGGMACVVDVAEEIPGGRSPCDGNPCGSPDAGACIPSGQSGYACSCNSGYVLSSGVGPMSCVKDGGEEIPGVPSPCEGNPCGSPEAGTCQPSGQSVYTCSCNPGYELSPDSRTCVQAGSDACASNPCGPKSAGVCSGAPGGYSCNCSSHHVVTVKSGGVTCVPDRTYNPCDNNGCGKPEAVDKCIRVGFSGKICMCKPRVGEVQFDPSGDVVCTVVDLHPESEESPGEQPPSVLPPRPGDSGASDGSDSYPGGGSVGGGEYPSEGGSGAPGAGVPSSPGGSGPTYPDGSIPTYPDGSSPTYPDGSSPTYPDGSSPTYPDGSIPTYPGGSGSTGGGGSGSGTPSNEEKEKEEKGGVPIAAIAGGIVGGLALIAVAGGAYAWKQRSGRAVSGAQVEFEPGSSVEGDEREDVEVLVDVDSKAWE
ncbi:microneme protein mic6 [Cystoisospora suis]|uniref:Microneme protein mic6 n=1 Tax=Cystoisospora suis TaxID=483139 RepID=A0A2C6LG26_9APIC|nr:microneme protein mic6 [Cystoisospora suis]